MYQLFPGTDAALFELSYCVNELLCLKEKLSTSELAHIAEEVTRLKSLLFEKRQLALVYQARR